MNTPRTSEELETLRSDLRALRADLRQVATDVGELSHAAARAVRQRPPVGEWLQRATGIDLNTPRGRDEAVAALRTHGEKSAAAMRSTMQQHPMGTALGALAVGLAIAWLLTRPSSDR